MTPRRDRFGEPIEDVEPPTNQRIEGRHCWRCGRGVDTDGPVPVCDSCAAATRQQSVDAHARRSSARRGRADVRPRDTDALRRRADRDAVERGLLEPRPTLRRWWEAREERAS